jgi:hypothetical protein
MKRKNLRIDWDELEAAFDNPNEELVYYLDLVEGRIVLEGEGEEDDFADDDEHFVAAPAAPRSQPADNTRLYIDRLTAETKLGWIRGFLDDTDDLDEEFVAKLEAAVASDTPAQSVIEVMRETPEGKDRWYLYRSDRLHDLIGDWLKENEITPTDDPPWVDSAD